jgi:pimeloyl-ACP methyl ester carboxylesterase
MPDKLLFLPGASGNTAFWKPVADLLAHPARRVHLGWPGFGPTPADPAVKGIDDLVGLVLAEMDTPAALVAQSMGGVIALLAALARPELVTHLVLTATSGGLDLSSLGAKDWRPDFCAANPDLPPWFADYRVDLTGRLATVRAPVLLLWGDNDPISPVRVGERLAELLPDAELHVIPGGDHDIGNTHAREIAPLIDRHLTLPH